MNLKATGAALLLLASCGLFANEARAHETLKIAVADPICRESACSCVTGILREYGESVKLLETRSGIKLELSYFEDELKLQRELKNGSFDGVIGKYSVFGGAVRDAKRKFTRLADISKPDGDFLLRGVFIVFKNSTLPDLASAKGKALRCAFGEEDAPEKAELAFNTLSKLGVEIPDMASRQEYFTCKEAALALLERRADVAVISDYALQFGCIVVVGNPKDFRVIGRTDKALPFTTFMVDNAKVSKETQTRLAAALLSISGDATPKELMSKGFGAPQPWPDDVRLP